MLSNTLKMIKIDWNMSELWQVVCKNIIVTIVHFLVLLCETYQCMDLNYITITTNLELPHLHIFHDGKHIILQASICSVIFITTNTALVSPL